MINWNLNSREEAEIIASIVERYIGLCLECTEKRKINMDITACHLNGNPLDLDRLLNAPIQDFLHDIQGIRNTIDRNTGKLTNCFVPRYSLQNAEVIL